MTTSTVRGLTSLSGGDPDDYQPHALHAEGRTYRETNCYTDIVIELLHATGYEPLAAFGHLVRMDFEGDQWTFFKPPPEDLESLFGVDIHEMQPYRPLPVQIAEQIEQGRTLIVELDSWYLPDTASTSYRSEHVKTSVAADAIDSESETMRYFHSAGLFECSGEDYRGLFRIGRPFSDDVLPPYTELVRFDAGPALQGDDLHAAARGLLARHLGKRPSENPFERFGTALERELPALLEGDLDDYHAYAFATVRMAGAAFEILSSHAAWLFDDNADSATEAMEAIVNGCKAMSFRLARRRPFDPGPLVESMAHGWDRAIAALGDLAG
ncbi:MAG TPA: DUF1839 family protein [Solirubrobacteraceae bacterium]|jgi:hypothetical protein